MLATKSDRLSSNTWGPYLPLPQQLRALASLPRDLGLIPAPTGQLTTVTAGDWIPSDFLRHCVHNADIHTGKTLIKYVNLKEEKKEEGKEKTEQGSRNHR